MPKVSYTPTFVRKFQKLSSALQADVDDAIRRFEHDPHDRSLRMHKLKGKLRTRFSFSVNYAWRVVCERDADGTFALLTVGDHDVYR